MAENKRAPEAPEEVTPVPEPVISENPYSLKGAAEAIQERQAKQDSQLKELMKDIGGTQK